MINDIDRAALLTMARQAIETHLGAPPSPAPVPSAALQLPAGAFVTLHHHGSLRGCIGHVEADERLVDVVTRCAVAAAISDPRFPAVGAAELRDLEVEISVLGPLEPITEPGEVEIGRHGVVVEQGWRRGLLLPQVAAERDWDAVTFLQQSCYKAGLPGDAWQRGARVWRFTADVFAESSPRTPQEPGAP